MKRVLFLLCMQENRYLFIFSYFHNETTSLFSCRFYYERRHMIMYSKGLYGTLLIENIIKIKRNIELLKGEYDVINIYKGFKFSI